MNRHFSPSVARRAFVFASLGGLQLLTACGDAGSTGGKRIELAASVEAESLAFENAYGYRVELRRALLSIATLHYLTGAPVAQRSMIERVLGIGVAHAHPGHYVAGGVLGEMLQPRTVDLAAGSTSLGVGSGIGGTALSGRFAFESPATGDLGAALGADVVLVEGEATLGAASRSFLARGRLEDVVDVQGEPVVEGCEFLNGALESSGSVRLVVRPALWLDQVDFSQVPAAVEDEVVELAPDATPHKAFARGLKKAAAYSFEYSAGVR